MSSYDIEFVVKLCREFDISVDIPYKLYVQPTFLYHYRYVKKMLTEPSLFSDQNIQYIIDLLKYKMSDSTYYNTLYKYYIYIPFIYKNLLLYVINILQTRRPITKELDQNIKIINIVINKENLLYTLNNKIQESSVKYISQHNDEINRINNNISISQSLLPDESFQDSNDNKRIFVDGFEVPPAKQVKKDSTPSAVPEEEGDQSSSSSIYEILSLKTIAEDGWVLLRDMITVNNYEDYLYLFKILGIEEEDVCVHVLENMLKYVVSEACDSLVRLSTPPTTQ